MATREVMRHPIRAFLLAPLTLIPVATVVLAAFYIAVSPLPEDGVFAVALYALQFVIAAILGSYFFAGLYVVPVLMLLRIGNGFYVVLVAVVPAVIAAIVFHMGLTGILVMVQLALLITFSCWFIGTRPKRHRSLGDNPPGLREA